MPESCVGKAWAWNRLEILILAWNSNSGVGMSPNVIIYIHLTRFLCKFWRRAMQILAWSDTDSGVEPLNSGVDLSNSGVERSPTLMLHMCSIWLHRACTYAAQGQHVAA